MIIASASAKSSHHGGTENTEKSPLFQAHSIPRARLPGASGGSFSGFPSSDSHDLVDPRKENLPVSDLPRKARLLYRIGNCLGLGIFHHRHEIHLGNKIDVVFSPAVDFHVPSLASESLYFADGHPLNAKSRKGPLATGRFASMGTAGLVAGNARFFINQVLAVAVVGGYSYGSSWLIGLVLDQTMGLRVGDEEESLGLDRELHGEVGYSQ